MKRSTLLRLMAAGAAGFGTPARAEEAAPPPHVTAAELTPELDGKEVTMAFEVADFYPLTGTVPVGQVPSFGMTPVQMNPAYRFSVLVSGDLADVMYRFGMTSSGEHSARGRVMQATGRLRLFPAEAGRKVSYQLHIRDWKKFHLLPAKQS